MICNLCHGQKGNLLCPDCQGTGLIYCCECDLRDLAPNKQLNSEERKLYVNARRRAQRPPLKRRRRRNAPMFLSY